MGIDPTIYIDNEAVSVGDLITTENMVEQKWYLSLHRGA